MSNDLEDKKWEQRIRDKRLWEAIGKRIRVARHHKGLSVEELAPMVGLVPQTIYRMEIGVVGTTLTRLLDICKVLDIDIAELLGVADNDSTQLRLAMRGRHLTPEQLGQLIELVQKLTGDE